MKIFFILLVLITAIPNRSASPEEFGVLYSRWMQLDNEIKVLQRHLGPNGNSIELRRKLDEKRKLEDQMKRAA